MQIVWVEKRLNLNKLEWSDIAALDLEATICDTMKEAYDSMSDGLSNPVDYLNSPSTLLAKINFDGTLKYEGGRN